MELTLEERVYRLEVALRLHAPTIEKNVDYGDILLTILERYSGKKRAELTGKNRWRQNVYIRQIGMNLLMDYTPMSLTAIGLVFGGRDHSTVIYAREQHADRLLMPKINKEYIQDWEKLKQYFTQAILGNNEHLEPIINPS